MKKAKDYSIYEQYGLTYNMEQDRFYYNGKQVRFFEDNSKENGIIVSFSYFDGDVDLQVVRENGKITGIKEK